jgi:uncharacterized protein with HEPN domain
VSPRDWKERIQDILEAISEIYAFTHGMDFETFCDDAIFDNAMIRVPVQTTPALPL